MTEQTYRTKVSRTEKDKLGVTATYEASIEGFLPPSIGEVNNLVEQVGMMQRHASNLGVAPNLPEIVKSDSESD